MVSTGDFNNDGELDLLWRNSTNGLNIVWFLSGANFMSANYVQPLRDTNWIIASTGYFGGANDKNIDILWRNTTTGDNAIWHLNGTTVVSTELIQEVPDLNWRIVGAADFNNDGYTDILWRHSTGLNAVWYMQGGTNVTSALLQSESDANWEIVGTGYFSGSNDNTVDLLWRYKTTGDNAIWQLNGVTFVNAQMITWASTNWMVGGTGDSKVDTDGDGLPDIWERRFFGDVTQTASADPDADNQSNATEYQNGSDPTTSNTLQLIGNAVENNLLTWSSGGNLPWVYWTASSYTNGNSAKSGAIGDDQISWLETKVLGPGTFSFHWKVSTEGGGDILYVTCFDVNNPNVVNVNTGITRTGTYSTFQQQHTFSLYPGTNRIYFEYYKNSSGANGDDAVYIDNVQYSFGGDNSNTTNSLAAAVDDIGRTYTRVGHEWIVVPNSSAVGGSMARSAYNVPDNDSSSMSTTITGPGTLSFNWGVSSEYQYDFLYLYEDYSWVAGISGAYGDLVPTWPMSVSISAGTHNIRWIYIKDDSDSAGEDGACVDNVRFIPDSDADGLGDDWETTHFGNTTSQNATGDYDADGFNNLQEYLNGTNPTKAELRVKVSSPRKGSLLP